jgi:predicted lipoprotein with Yx(FWY)xxD motif
MVVSGKPTAAGGARGGLLATTTRSGDVKQVTYNGHPLYYYSGDQKAGDTNGQGLDQFGAKWYVLDASGNRVTSAPPTSGGGY